MAALELYAGPKALTHLREHGLTADAFDYLLGASGGPKWFVLAGLDRVLAPHFFANRTKPLHCIGSSAGAFRFACIAQTDPLAAINRLAERYSHTVYSAKPTASEISDKGRELLDYVLGEQGVTEILNNPVFKAHFIVARCKGLTRFESRPLQLAGLLASASANFSKRARLGRFFERFVFSTPGAQLEIDDPHGLPSRFADLSSANLKLALMASGSIPMVLEGVRNIPGAPKGMYRDGGIIDYHFDLSFGLAEGSAEGVTEGSTGGLVLYPHFFARPAPGWFDKSLRFRRPALSSYDNVLMLVPSQSFVAGLPHRKIPDRKDFETMAADARIAYWSKVLSETNRLGEEFLMLAEKRDISHLVKPIAFAKG
ncbi:patatin-like phospholipase family protein [Aliiglaciecola sp. CAU 1673]|uniref:patatin-like phospholipase family protein n=1 Tax=Aliiglaciecola sp. CAU 1673 TaxID=3032595 RepID=UPI0023DC03A5|nr:patatin-like phospholipase family protein [Aliiglaciecola sp. CAU 1673]MDF2177737.1 patatin-like phospholipase family protein [Aliiglaciecola sp. CAU 1673]